MTDITHEAAREAHRRLIHWPAHENRRADQDTLSAYIAQCEKREALLSDPLAVHANMLRGGIAMPTPEAIEHLYQDRLPSVAEARRLRSLLNEAGEVDDKTLAERMKAAGMRTLEEMLQPSTPFQVHAGMTGLAAFESWLERKTTEFQRMQVRRTLDKQDGDELFEWVIAHAATFHEVLVNFRAALRTNGGGNG